MSAPAAQPQRPRTTVRDPDLLARRLRQWLAGRLPPGADPLVPGASAPASNGMSSETVLFDASWTQAGRRHDRSLVARVAPDPQAVPVFPVYDLHRQFRIMRAVRELSAVPVPEVLWWEPDPAPLGAPFFVMERLDGEVPPDVLPYTFGSWVSEASPAQRARMQEGSVRVLADLHAVPHPEDTFGYLACPGGSALRAHVAGQREFYAWVSADGIRSPLIERAFGWIDEHWPARESDPVLSWGDARIGNIVYRDFVPVGVLDWEMAGLATPETDIGWFVFLHRFFDDLALRAGLPGLPDFCRRDDVAAAYERMSGHTPRDLDFYLVYAALRHAIVMFRIQRRAVHFGEATMPEDPDDMVMHRQALEEMLAGRYRAAAG